MATAPPFPTSTDPWGRTRDYVPPPPLGFDRAMESRAPTSDSALFQFPVEIIGRILHFIDLTSLSNLALVNRDCRQLARSRQFASVHLDFSPASVALVHFLVSETNERMVNNGSTSLPSIGACIRRVAVATSQHVLMQRFDIPKYEWERNEHLNEEELKIILCHGPTLPHLEYLDWEDAEVLSQSFFISLACTPIQHLKLYRPEINHDFEIVLPESHVSRSWPLRTLHIEYILRLCAPTLEILIWTGLNPKDQQTFGPGPAPDFPCLRNLQIEGFFASADDSVMDTFLKSKLVRLSISLRSRKIAKSLEFRGCIPTLKILAMAKPPLDFLQANPQLVKIDFDYCYGFSAEELEIEVLPVISTFSQLTSLRIFWPEACSSLPTSGLRFISKIRTLVQLCIHCGKYIGWRRNWEVRHEDLRLYLSPLQSLKRLVLGGDTYGTNPERYYVDTFATGDDLGHPGMPFDTFEFDEGLPMIIPEKGKPYWEKRHSRKMVAEAEEYIGVFPDLEWIYFGERGMDVIVDDEVGTRRIVSAAEVDDSYQYFAQAFGKS
ncbi:hypothetical protein BKA61DRAFT_495389 [Leptodontidium sp. MPI-SDFR-AT-0119]|nr:hypothetical protein BKA61DRAFT_495389 [Leptodontidium sp. MPI-SDFR-AT-0119]